MVIIYNNDEIVNDFMCVFFEHTTGMARTTSPIWNAMYGYWVCTCVPRLICPFWQHAKYCKLTQIDAKCIELLSNGSNWGQRWSHGIWVPQEKSPRVRFVARWKCRCCTHVWMSMIWFDCHVWYLFDPIWSLLTLCDASGSYLHLFVVPFHIIGDVIYVQFWWVFDII